MKKSDTPQQANAKEQEQPQVEFPYEYKRPKCSVAFKIYKTPRDDYDAFTLVYYQEGLRKRVLKNTFEAALAEADEVAKLLGSKDVDVLELKSADRAAYKRAREVLDPLGISIEVAAVEYAHIKRILGDVSPIVAAEYYKRKHPMEITAKRVPVVVKEFLEAKEADGCSKRYLNTLKYNLGAFAKRFRGNIEPVVGGEIDAWLRTSGLSPRTRNNIRTSLYTLFKFAVGRRYLPKDHDELESVSVVNDRDGDIEVFTAAELAEVLCCASERMIPFLVLGAFAGIRHAEIQRLEWRDVRFDEGAIEIHASKAKTASRRLVPIVPVLKEWLLKFRQAAGLVVSHRNVAFELHMIAKTANQLRRAAWAEARGVTEEQLKQAEKQARELAAKRKKSKLRSQKGEVPPGAETAEIEGWEPFAWKNNGLRHSYISYRLAAVQNTAQVALEAGNSPQMIFQHYRELVRPADAEKWFAVTLASVEAARAEREAGKDAKIVKLPKQAVA
ncbi:MAG TPA: site-specific integrase [Verrucomicrobiota bacterium]|jgi:integrase|nr:site-specific integrase [Verrucomicrobiota bacterium]HOH40537.1 site-specific integrase [Verrucomicrobiota bacterium]